MRGIDENGNEFFAYYESSVCHICKHYISDITCKAYPDEIPEEIYCNDSPRKYCSKKNDFAFEIVDELKEMYDKFYNENGSRRAEENK